MRAGGCAVQQALTAEAAGVVRQAVSLARRRGHAQVTPLHVASAMLSAAGLLRAACLRSHSHPLQCKALELCFNVALNRLPTSAVSASPMLAPHHHHHGHHLPTLSNALVAAFKRAQAHQRRGSAESQQQPLLAVKVELEQLIISILDDPSVSRVMREAGFSSTQVKANVEKAVSPESNTAPTPPTAKPKEGPKKPSEQARGAGGSGDAARVLDCLAGGRKRCVVVVGECSAAAEGVVRVVMDRVSRGEVGRHEALKNVQFIPLSLASFRRMSREEVESKAGELRALARSVCAAGKGVVVVLEDLGCAAEAWAAASEQRGLGGAHGCYCPVEHAVMEVSSLVSRTAAAGGGGERFWMLGFATYQNYMQCRAGHPSLEAIWGLHPVTVPDGSLALSLGCDSTETQSSSQARARTAGWSFLGESELTCCAECSGKFTAEARNSAVSASTLPPWLRPYQDPDRNRSASCDTNQLQDLCNKWNSICSSSAHRSSELTLDFSLASPATSFASGYSHRQYKPWTSLSFEAKHPWQGDRRCGGVGARLCEPAISANPNPSPNSVSSSDGGTTDVDRRPKFKELSAENLKMLCNALERRVARQRDIVPEIASVVLQCRSGMRRRRGKAGTVPPGTAKGETWLLFHGGDDDGKHRVARELASLVFGSCSRLVSIGPGASARSDSSDESSHSKRQRLNSTDGFLERLRQAVCENPHRVIVIEDVDQLDEGAQIGIRKAIESGAIEGCNGGEVAVDDAIIVLSCEAFDSRSRVCSPRGRQKVGDGEEEEKGIGSGLSLDLNACAEDDHEGEEDRSLHHDVGLVDVVDGVFFFRLPEDL